MLNQEQVDKEIKSIEECFRIDEYLKPEKSVKNAFFEFNFS